MTPGGAPDISGVICLQVLAPQRVRTELEMTVLA